MRGIALLTSLFPPSVGGIQTQTLALARALAELGTEVHVVTRPAAGRPAREDLDGVLVHRIGVGRAPTVAATAAYVGLAAREVASLGERIGIVHAHQLLSPATAALVVRATLALPFVVTTHGSGTVGEVAALARQGALGRARLAALRRWAGAFVAVSAPIRDELVAAGIPESRIRRIPNGVDERRFAPAGPSERRRLRRELGLGTEPVAVYSGRLAPEKGLDVLLDAWARVGDHGTLVLVGEGPERDALEARARGLGISGSVRFAGAAADVAPWLRAASAFVLPSRAEGLSVALLEAMSCALPVVATDVGATGEATEGCAVVVPPDDAIALAAALHVVLDDADRAQALGAAGRTRVVARYGIRAVARRHLELYEEVAEEARRSTGSPRAVGEGAHGPP